MLTPNEEQELLELVRHNHQLMKEQVEIAREYKAHMGDPLRHIAEFLHSLGKFIAWIFGAILTWWGLREMWNNWFIPKFK